jgi:hypothetical protein
MPMKLNNSFLLGPKGMSVVQDMVNLHVSLFVIRIFLDMLQDQANVV